MVWLGIVISFLVVLAEHAHHGDGAHSRGGHFESARLLRVSTVVRMLLGETLIIAVMGTTLGILLTFLTQAILKETSPGLTVLISPSWIFSAIGLALVGAAAGAVYPALRAASYDPVVALAYE